MVDITHKHSTLRIATAESRVKVSSEATIKAIKNGEVPKGDVFAMSRAAGLLGVKKTPELLPDCHPMPIEHTDISYEIEGLEIIIHVLVKTIYKTGVEVEAMHGASIVALNIYDMLKPIDKGVEIGSIRLLQKKGGKSDFAKRFRKGIKAHVVVCSDSIAAGDKEDKAGLAIMDVLKANEVETAEYSVISDDKSEIESQFQKAISAKTDLLIYTGGTGVSPRDNTPDVILPLLDKEMPGVMEAARSYGQDRTPYAMLSRGVAGIKGNTLVLTLPGSTKGAQESMDALFPFLLHIFGVLKGARHD